MEEIKTIQEEVQKLLEHIGIEAEVAVEKTEDGYPILVTTSESALLIGRHGNTLSSLEYLLSFILTRRFGEYKRIILEIGGYRKEREEYLKNLALRLKEDVISTGIQREIRGLKPWERRVVHLFFKDESDVTTESQGEERERVLVIKKK